MKVRIPLVLALVHPPEGIRLDAVLTTPQEASVVFSFTRSYFHIEPVCAAALVAFLAELMPLKPIDELYTAIGCHKHGKTLLFHALLRQLEDPEARFEIAEGEPGLVMVVFALPSFNVVFKIIRDHFGAPKTTTREEVMAKYRPGLRPRPGGPAGRRPGVREPDLPEGSLLGGAAGGAGARGGGECPDRGATVSSSHICTPSAG